MLSFPTLPQYKSYPCLAGQPEPYGRLGSTPRIPFPFLGLVRMHLPGNTETLDPNSLAISPSRAPPTSTSLPPEKALYWPTIPIPPVWGVLIDRIPPVAAMA